jgi:hypothetical protein
MEDGVIDFLDSGSTAGYTLLLVFGDTPAIVLVLCFSTDESIGMSTSGCRALLGMPRVVGSSLAFKAKIVVCIQSNIRSSKSEQLRLLHRDNDYIPLVAVTFSSVKLAIVQPPVVTAGLHSIPIQLPDDGSLRCHCLRCLAIWPG